MKKRVRIYKAPDGEGKFINKTAQFLQKAQEGGMPSVEDIGYPGAGQQQAQQVDENQLASAVLTDISNSEPRERIIIKLVNTYGKDPMEAQQFVDQMYQYVEQQQQSETDDAEEEEDSESVTTGKDTVEEVAVEQVQDGPTGTEMSNEMIAEDDVQDDDSQAASDVIMRYGGYPRAQEGMEVPIEMPDTSAYLPSNMADYLGDGTNPYAEIAWNTPTLEEQEETVFSDYTEPQLPEERFGGMPSKRSYVNSVLKLVKKQMGGDSAAPASAKFDDDNADPTGANVRKKSLDKFIGSVKNQSAMAFAKKQAEENYDQMMQMQQQAPAPQYPMAQNGGEQNIYQGQDFENPMHHLALFSNSVGNVFQDNQNQVTKAQEGIQINKSGMDIDPGFTINPATGKPWTRGEWEAEKQKSAAASEERTRMDDWIRSQMAGNQNVQATNPGVYGVNPYAGNPFAINPYGNGRQGLGMFTRGYKMPRGFGYGMPPITRMDVRRSGWFGRPKEYSIEFGQMSPMPGMGMPGQGAGFYGYGSRTIKYPATRIKVESEAASVNQKAKEEVSATTPDSKATTDAAKTDVTTTVSTTTEGTVASNTVPGNTTQTETVTTEGKTETTPVNPRIVKPTDQGGGDKKELGNGTYAYPGKNGIYKKQDGVWYVDVTGTGTKYQQLKSGDVKARINALEANATPKNPVKPIKPTQPQIQRDQWGRPAGSRSYGFNPDTGKFEEGLKEKQWDTKKGEKATSFESTYKTDWGTVKPARYQIVRDKNGRIIPEKSFAAVQQSEDYGGVIYVPWNDLPNRNPEKGEDWNNGYGGDMMENKFGGSVSYQMGGSINDPFMDPYGNLQQFIGGGDQEFTQGDLDDTYSKDTANGDFPMAQRGMLVRNLFPANIMPTQYTQMRGVPYNPQTGKPVANYIPGAGTGIKKIDVTKSSWITGRPKKYTITYGTQEMDPRKQNLITLPGSGTETPESQSRRPERADVEMPQRQRTDVSDLGMRAAMAVRKGERQAYRNDKRLARHPEYMESIFTPEQLAERQAAKDAYMNAMKPQAPVYPGMSANQIQSFTDMMQNPAGLPGYSEGSKYFSIPEIPVTAPTSAPFSADMLYNMSGPRVDAEMQYGGDLQRFIPRADVGAESPVVYTNNPALHGMSQVDMISLNPGIQGLGASSLDTSFMNTNTPTRDQSNDPKQYTVDPTQIGSHQAENVYQGPEEDVAVDYKVKNSVDPEAIINVTNAGIRGVTGILNRRDAARQEAKMSDNLTADNLYASDPSKDRGDYDTNSGLYRMDEMGQKWNSRSKQYGGNIYQDGGMVEGDEVFMTDEEIQEFLANGGDLEFI
jgi:hypothetical protein